MTSWDKISWKPLGTGRQAPASSIPSRKLAQKIADYKNRVAGRYRSLSPQDITRLSGDMILSPKIDGETWFLYSKNGEAYLLSPSGKVITDVPVTEEAKNIINDRQLLLAGELYASGAGRPRVYDLHSALGGGDNAKTDN